MKYNEEPQDEEKYCAHCDNPHTRDSSYCSKQCATYDLE